jgi:SAM-dependent methyltransferase
VSEFADPDVVRCQYADERRLVARSSVWRPGGDEGPHAVALRAIAEIRPDRVLEVGCGWGDFAVRIAAQTGAEVIALDLSPRMVELARERGVDARVGDVQELPFRDGEFDCAVAVWMLYHVPDLDRGLAELARVLRPGGRLVAITNGVGHLAEMWALLGGREGLVLPFRRENGAEILSRHFASVTEHDLHATAVFEDRESIERYLGSLHPDVATALPEVELPFHAHGEPTVFVADR